MQKRGEAHELRVPSAARQELSYTIITVDVAVVLQLGHIFVQRLLWRHPFLSDISDAPSRKARTV